MRNKAEIVREYGNLKTVKGLLVVSTLAFVGLVGGLLACLRGGASWVPIAILAVLSASALLINLFFAVAYRNGKKHLKGVLDAYGAGQNRSTHI